MKLQAPRQAIDFQAVDTSGQQFQLSDYSGKSIVLSFFRDASCPFCNLRLYEFSRKHKEWSELGIEIVAVFSSPGYQINEFVARHPRPFKMIGDPQLEIYNLYGVEHSRIGFYRALLFKIPQIVKGIKLGAKPDPKNPHPRIVPADFLIGPNGQIVDLWYGKDVADHMPMTRLERFVDRVRWYQKRQSSKRAEIVKSKAAKKTEAKRERKPNYIFSAHSN